MNFPLSTRLRKMYWLNWLEDYVEYDGEWFPRQDVIMNFVEEDLIPFLKSYGYILNCKPKELAQIIARELFHYLCNKRPLVKWHSKHHNNRFRQEDLDHFYHTIDTREWERFWEHTCLWCDVTEDKLRTRSIIEYAAWSCLDIKYSPATDIVNDMLDSDDDDSIASNKDKGDRDPYLSDQNNNDY